MTNEITIKELLSLLSALTDGGECRYDHHGYCQEHGWFYTDEVCPHKRAKELLDWQDKQHFRLVIEVHDQI